MLVVVRVADPVITRDISIAVQLDNRPSNRQYDLKIRKFGSRYSIGGARHPSHGAVNNVNEFAQHQVFWNRESGGGGGVAITFHQLVFEHFNAAANNRFIKQVIHRPRAWVADTGLNQVHLHGRGNGSSCTAYRTLN